MLAFQEFSDSEVSRASQASHGESQKLQQQPKLFDYASLKT
jgi:hypothetical protein